jgi:antitoxin ChpS
MNALHLDIGDQMEVAVTGDGFVARPLEKPKRRRYSLRELLCGATPETMRRSHAETAWAREGAAVGREL